MTFETVYEISKHPFPTFIVVVLGFLIAMVIYSINRFKEFREKDVVTSKNSAKLLGEFLICVFLLITLIVEGKGGGMPQRYANAYYSGDYEVVEGEITERVEPKGGNVRFTVNGKEFSVVRFINNPVPEEGYIRVTYVCVDDVEEVVKLEVATE